MCVCVITNDVITKKISLFFSIHNNKCYTDISHPRRVCELSSIIFQTYFSFKLFIFIPHLVSLTLNLLHIYTNRVWVAWFLFLLRFYFHSGRFSLVIAGWSDDKAIISHLNLTIHRNEKVYSNLVFCTCAHLLRSMGVNRCIFCYFCCDLLRCVSIQRLKWITWRCMNCALKSVMTRFSAKK